MNYLIFGGGSNGSSYRDIEIEKLKTCLGQKTARHEAWNVWNCAIMECCRDVVLLLVYY